MSSRRRRVLFVAENITLAQVVRLNVLARHLDPNQFDIHFACAAFDGLIFDGLPGKRHTLHSLSAKRVFAALERGQRLYDFKTLKGYVSDELALFDAVKPDVVVGDMRLSLSVSAPHFGVPYAALINAYWSRQMQRKSFPMPDHPIVSLLGERIASKYFPKAMPRVLAHFAEPINKLRKVYGLPPLGDLIDVLLAGDAVLFPDIPEITPLENPPAHQQFLGPVLWSPNVPVSPLLRTQEPFIYVTLGSSGRVDRLPVALAGLAHLDLPRVVATAGRYTHENLGPNVHAFDFVPGSTACKRAAFVVCNGGSSTAYQALAEGTPVLGIASNLDQYLAMSAIEAQGAGILLRAGSVTSQQVQEAAHRLLNDPSFTAAAQRLQAAFRRYDPAQRFAQALTQLGSVTEPLSPLVRPA